MAEENYKEVLFWKFCKKCMHSRKKENEDPCYDCLKDHHNPNSHKPTYFVPAEEGKK